MKKYCFLLLISIVTLASFGQSNYEDVVYLKNGGIVRGIIIEQVPDKSIKIETIGRNVFFYEMDEISKITKEQAAKRNQKSFERRGYIGTSLGLSLPVGGFEGYGGKVNNGVQLNLVNFGYLFNGSIGITATWFGTANSVNNNIEETWTYGGLMIGPLISSQITPKVELDFRPMVGYSLVRSPELFVFSNQRQIRFNSAEASSIAINLGSVFRFNVRNGFALFLSVDYFNARPDFGRDGIAEQIESVTFGFGGAFRLR